MQRFNICSVEQPVPAHDLEGMRRVREETGLAVVADESLCTLDDARRLISASAADVFNIRIAKCGGLLASTRLVRLAGDSGLRCQLGTLVGETGVLLRAAEIFSRRIKGFEFFEGRNQREHLLMEDLVEPFTNSERTADGLGVALSRSKLTRWMVSEPKSFHSTGRRAA
jgi:muconate cycloisomerase